MSIGLMLIVLLVCAYLWWSQTRRIVKVAASTPTLSGFMPLIGHAHRLINSMDGVGLLKFVDDASREANHCGGVLKGWIGPILCYVITDPEDALTVLNACLKKNYVYRYFEPFLGEGLFTARSVRSWKRRRKLMIPAFNQQILDSFLHVFNRQSRCLADRMAVEVDRGPFDHWPYLAFNGLESICQTVLGVPDSGEDLVGEEYGRACQTMFNLVMRRVTRIWLCFDWIFKWTHWKTEQDEAVKVFHKLSSDVMEKNKLRMKKGNYAHGHRFKSVMDILLELSSQGALTDREIQEEVDTMIMAGHDTSSTSILFTLFILGSYVDVQDRVCDDILKVLGPSDRDVTKEDLPKLVYLDAVLKESMRLYPVAATVLRYADRDVQLKNCTVATGAHIIVSVWGLHRNEQCWGQDVEQFRPERWLKETEVPVPSGAFGTFSLGRRGCIGKSYAFMSMKTTMVHLLRRYRFSSDYDDLTLKMDSILKIHSGGKVAIELR